MTQPRSKQPRSEQPRSKQSWPKSWSLAAALVLSVVLVMLAGLVPSAANDDVRLCPDPATARGIAIGTSIDVDTEDGRQTIHTRRGRCVLHLEVHGELDAGETIDGVPRLAPGTSLEIEERYRGARRRLEIRGGSDGNDYVWYADGKRRPFDSVGRAWLTAILPEIYRTTGLAAEQRAAAIFARDGSAGVLAEIALIHGDWVERRYLQALLEEPRLPAEDVPGVVHAAAKTLGSDHHLADLLIQNVELLAENGARRHAYVDATKAIGSDHHMARALVALVLPLEDGAESGEILDAALQAARGIGSDHHLAGLLIQIAESRDSEAALPASFFVAAGDVGSDHHLGQVLHAVIARPRLEPETLERLLATARDIGSDHHLAEVLVDLLSRHPLPPEIEPAFARTARGIGSRHHSERVASARERSGD